MCQNAVERNQNGSSNKSFRVQPSLFNIQETPPSPMARVISLNGNAQKPKRKERRTMQTVTYRLAHPGQEEDFVDQQATLGPHTQAKKKKGLGRQLSHNGISR